jgi:hypothetical protein
MYEAYARPSGQQKYTPMVLSAPMKKDLALMVYKTFGLNWKNNILLHNERCLLPPSNYILPVASTVSNLSSTFISTSTSTVPTITKTQINGNNTNSSNTSVVTVKEASDKRRRTIF